MIRRGQAAMLPDHIAENLLQSWLSPEQWLSYRQKRFFLVRGDAGGLYRINCAPYHLNYNIEQLKPQRAGLLRRKTGAYVVARKLCAYPQDSHLLPPADVWLAQMLAIRHSEMHFWRTAHVI